MSAEGTRRVRLPRTETPTKVLQDIRMMVAAIALILSTMVVELGALVFASFMM